MEELGTTESHVLAAAAKNEAPHATAGEGKVPAPELMKAWQLKDQALALVGQVCVITAIPQGTEQRCFAGKLMRLGDSMVFLRSTCYNDNAEVCVKHEGPEDALETLPVDVRPHRLSGGAPDRGGAEGPERP